MSEKKPTMTSDTRFNNFDLLRLTLALVVYLVHTEALSLIIGTPRAIFTHFLSSKVAIDGFFVISGFLIFASMENSKNAAEYAGKRVRRIAPAYAAVVLLCAVIGAFISAIPLNEYFSAETAKYVFYNLLTLNFLHPELPGVFQTNFEKAVNGSLWTIKIEVMFYVTVPFFVYLFTKFKRNLLLILLYAMSSVYLYMAIYLADTTGNEIYRKFSLLLPGSLMFFVSGGYLYYNLDRFKELKTVLLPLAVLGVVAYKYVFNHHPLSHFLYPVSLAVIIVYAAHCLKYLGNFCRYGDFSYGIYIWHFPVVQTFAFYGLYENYPAGFAMATALIVTLAVLSWHLVEKPFLKKSSHYIVASDKT